MMEKLIVRDTPVLLCSLLLLAVSAAVASTFPAYPITKSSNCTYRCGNITIPFPFGIGGNCFLDEWYEILCANHMPRLKKLDLQVLNISFPFQSIQEGANTITVKQPIVYSNSSCGPNGVGKPVNFSGSPFVISGNDNIFVAAGCGNDATLRYSNSIFVGCSTIACNRNETRLYGGSSCDDGFGCCQFRIPSDFLQDFRVDFREDQNSGASAGDQHCQFAFLGDSSWFLTGSTDLNVIQGAGHVPVVLLWTLLDTAFPASIGLTRVDDGQLSYSSEGSQCEESNYANVNTTVPIIDCYCHSGYNGNPYLKDGCKDINECEDQNLNHCSLRCENKQGYYRCVDVSTENKWAMTDVGGFFLALVFLLCVRWIYETVTRRKKMKRRQRFFKKNGGLLLQQQLASPEGNLENTKLFNFKELERATDNFNENRILGRGGQGTVYKGMLTDGRIVAVKRSIVLADGNVEQFINEVFILSQINHRNVVKLLGCCLETKVPLLVYEFIPNGTLYQYLHDPDEEFPVSWDMRLRIASEVAGAVFYLHSAASIPIYHRDIKTTNILLDEKYRAKIADFGTSRSVALDQTHVTTLVQGTFGYLDPEYFQSSQFTDKSDVYSFGVVLVELLTGQKPISLLRAEEGRSLATYFILSMENDRLFDILDARVLAQGNREDIIAVARLARRCLDLNGRKRPTMKEVAMELEAIRRPSHNPYDVQEVNRRCVSFEIDGIIEAQEVTFGAAPGMSSTMDVYPLLSNEWPS